VPRNRGCSEAGSERRIKVTGQDYRRDEDRQEALTLGADLVVIGAGSAGNAAFLAARRRGASWVLVAERSTIGGDCNEAFAQSAARLP